MGRFCIEALGSAVALGTIGISQAAAAVAANTAKTEHIKRERTMATNLPHSFSDTEKIITIFVL